MIIYGITFVFFAAVLIGAFRSMGGEPADAVAASAFLNRMVGWVTTERDSVADLGDGTVDSAEPLSERARAARKVLAGYQQQLTRFEVAGDDAAEVRRLLSQSIESLGWACRMAEIGTLSGNDGVATAAAGLYAHAGLVLDAARDIELDGVAVVVALTPPRG